MLCFEFCDFHVTLLPTPPPMFLLSPQQRQLSRKPKFNVSLTVHHELTIQNYQRDALNTIYSSNIITLLYMFRVSSTYLQEDIVVHKQHMVPSLSIES